MRRVLVGLLVTGALGLPTLTTSAATAAPSDRLTVLWTADASELVRHDLVGGELDPPASHPDHDLRSRYNDVTSSGDGSRLAYTTGSSSSFATTTEAVVTDVSGFVVRRLERGTSYCPMPSKCDEALVGRAILSFDGNAAVWSRTYDPRARKVTSLRRVSLPNGTPEVIRGGRDVVPVGFLDDRTIIGYLRGDDAQVVTLPLAGDATWTIADGDVRLREFSVAPDGKAIAYRTAEGLFTRTVTRSSYGGAVLGPAVQRATRTDLSGTPFFLADGRLVAPVADGCYVYAAGGTDALKVSSVSPVVAGGVRDTVAPAAPTVTAQLAGTTVRLTEAVPTADDLSAMVLRRDGTTRTAAGTTVDETGLTLGTRYSWGIAAVDRSGNVSPEVTHDAVATAVPQPRVTRLTAQASTALAFPVSLSASNPAETRYVAEWRRLPGTTWSPWVDGQPGGSRVFGAPASDGVAATSPEPGAAYEFRAWSVDGLGNRSATVVSNQAYVPFDQSRAAFSGSTRTVGAQDLYLGTAEILNAGASATAHFRGTAVWVLGERCATCGVVSVFFDNVKVADVDTRAASRQVRTVLWSRSVPTGAHVVTLVAKGTAGRPEVRLDAFAARP